MSGSINRVYKVVIEKGKKVSLGVLGDLFLDKKNNKIGVKVSNDEITILATEENINDQISSLKKYIDDQNKLQDEKINKNAEDIKALQPET